MLGLLDGPSQDRLEELADEPIPGSLLVLACRVPALASASAQVLGRRTLGAESARSDLVTLVPDGERWSVAEVTGVASRLGIMPVRRHFVVLERAGAMEQRAYDRLLRVVEEPPSPATVVLVCGDVGELPATLLGRASAALTLVPADPAEQVSALVSAGATLPAARESVALAGSQANWLPALAFSAVLRQQVRALTVGRLDPARPVGDALSRLGVAAAVAAAVDAADGGPVTAVPATGWDGLTPAVRHAARDLLRLFAEHRRAALLRALPTLDGSGLVTLQDCLAALTRFELRLSSAVTPSVALAALAAESPPLRLPGR